MRKLFAIGLAFLAIGGRAQDKKYLDSVDRVIIKQIIEPAEQSAGGQEPSWAALRLQIRVSYSEVQTDRAITKAQIYFNWSRDWAKFSTAIVHYTEAYEDKEDGKLMNKNAKFILEHSEDPKEWKTALGWVQHAADKEPDNADFKATRDALAAKVNGQ